MEVQIEKEDRHRSRVMRIHVYIHVRRKQRNEDADRKGRWAYEPGYVYTYLDAHKQTLQSGSFARRAITRALYQDTNIWNYLLLIFQVQTLIGFFVGLPIFYIGFVFLSQIRFWVLSQFLTYWGVYPTFRNFCHTGGLWENWSYRGSSGFIGLYLDISGVYPQITHFRR